MTKDREGSPDRATKLTVDPKRPEKPTPLMDSPTLGLAVTNSPRRSRKQVDGPQHSRTRSSPRAVAREKKPDSGHSAQAPQSPEPRSPVRVALSPKRVPRTPANQMKPTDCPVSPERRPRTPNGAKQPTVTSKSPRRESRNRTGPNQSTGSPRSPKREPRGDSGKAQTKKGSSPRRHTKKAAERSPSPNRSPRNPSQAPRSPFQLGKPGYLVLDDEDGEPTNKQQSLTSSRNSPLTLVATLDEDLGKKSRKEGDKTSPTAPKLTESPKRSKINDNTESKSSPRRAPNTRRIDAKVRTNPGDSGGGKHGSPRSVGISSVPGAVSVLNGVESHVTNKEVASESGQAPLSPNQEYETRRSPTSPRTTRRQNFEDALEAKKKAFEADTATEGGGMSEKSKRRDIGMSSAVNNDGTEAGLQNTMNDLEMLIESKIRGQTKKAPVERVQALEQQVRTKECVFDEADTEGRRSSDHSATTTKNQQSESTARSIDSVEDILPSKGIVSSFGMGQLQEFEHNVIEKATDNSNNDSGVPKRASEDTNPLTDPLDSQPMNYGGDLEEGEIKPAFVDGLAVAFPVQEEPDDNPFIPSAIEYDPEAKPMIYRNRRVRLYTGLVVFIITLLAIGLGVGISLYRNSSEDTPEDFSHRENLGIKETVEKTVGADVLLDESSPYAKALRWITYQDPQKPTPDAPNFMQRYILACIYFATSEVRPWSACNPPKNAEDDSCLYEKLDSIDPIIVNPASGFRWLSGAPECSWAGLLCDRFDQIREIDLAGFDLTGSFPVEVRRLPYLQALSMALNKLTGPLPKEVASMRHLVNIEIPTNAFTGTIPQEWFEHKNLQNFNIGKNKFAGPLSSSLNKWSNMRKIYLEENRFSGYIPTEFGDLNNLSFIRLDSNQLSGTIPTELGNISTLTVLQLQDNDLSGNIPSQVGRAGRLEVLRIQNNAQLTGKIPAKLFSTLDTLEAYNCDLSGDLTERFFLMKKMATLRIHNNQFSGRLPPNLGKIMPDIAQLWISGNSFTGSIPDSICDLRGPFRLSELVADCAPSNNRVVPEIVCPVGCCTECCNDNGGTCLTANSD